MAGYDGHSQSWNSVAAKEEGKWPLSHAVAIVAKGAGVTRKVAREALNAEGSCEWHHTSKKYNRTDFYDTVAVIESLSPGIAAQRVRAEEREAKIREMRRRFNEAQAQREQSLRSQRPHARTVREYIGSVVGANHKAFNALYTTWASRYNRSCRSLFNRCSRHPATVAARKIVPPTMSLLSAKNGLVAR